MPEYHITMTEVTCDNCGETFSRALKEVNRCKNRGRKMFCKPSCNSEAHTKPSKREGKCKKCGNDFISNKCKGKWSEYCSRSCASSDNVTDLRLQEARRTGRENSGNLLSVAESMKLREAWKYKELENALIGIQHEFEYPIGNYVFDLVLFEEKMLIEFDGPAHEIDLHQKRIDRNKNEVARKNGFKIVRIAVNSNEVIPVSVLYAIGLRTSTTSGLATGPGSRIPAPPPTIPATSI